MTLVLWKGDVLWFSVLEKTEQNCSNALASLLQLLVFIFLVNMKLPEWWLKTPGLLGF